MSITALFLSVCLHTSIDCESVEVSYSNLDRSVLGRATMMTSGRLIIKLAPSLGEAPLWLRRGVLLHETAHLVTWTENPDRILEDHGPTFTKTCEKLAKLSGYGDKICKDSQL